MKMSPALEFMHLEQTRMELLAYSLAIFGFFILIKGIKPSIESINKITDKDLAKGVVFIAIFLTVCFYILATKNYLLSF